MLRARFEYFKVFNVSSAFESAGLTHAVTYPTSKKTHVMIECSKISQLSQHTYHHCFAVSTKRILHIHHPCKCHYEILVNVVEILYKTV
jgi:hypothetical protein